MGEIEECLIIKKRLSVTWPVFFSHFGRLTPVQREAIPHLLSGKEALIISPTSSGKTEAVMAPICENIVKKRYKKLSTLYIIPTRALANDLFRRLNEQVSEIGLTIAIKTSDRPTFNEKYPPNILITTPESLDSILCRYPDNLKDVKSVVLDEIHNTDSKYRGDQLRVLLKRLRQHSPGFLTCAISATVSEPEKLAMRYFQSIPVICDVGSLSSAGRTIKEIYLDSIDEVLNQSKKDGVTKLLVFCNSRRNVEELSMKAKNIWGSDRVVAHHGSLSKNERDNSESFMKNERVGVCIATATLEVGIDIGDIQAIVLADIPWTVSSMLQRIGRGCRRADQIRVYAIVHSENKNLWNEMFKAAHENNVENIQYHFDRSVIVQQLFSMLFANRYGIDINDLSNFFKDFAYGEEVPRQIIPHLIEKGYVESRIGKLYASEKVMNWGEMGMVHSNIPNIQTMSVINTSTNTSIGDIELNRGEFNIGASFVLSGRAWKIARISGNKIFVKATQIESTSANFKMHYEFGSFFWLLPEDIKQEEINMRASK